MGKKKKNWDDEDDECVSRGMQDDPRVKETLDEIEQFADTIKSYLIPVGKSDDEIKDAIKQLKKYFKKYRAGKMEIFTDAYYDLLKDETSPIEEIYENAAYYDEI